MPAVLVGGAIGVISLLGGWSTKPTGPSPNQLARAEIGPLVVRVVESGEIEAERRDIVSNELNWPVFIKQIAADGSIINQNDTIVEFECRDLADAVDAQKLKVSDAENDYTQAHENVQLKKKELDNAVDKAQQVQVDANDDLRRYQEGDWPATQAESESAIELAKRDLTLAQGKLAFKVKANLDPELKTPYSASEIEADQLTVDRLKHAYEKAVTERDMSVKFVNPQQVRLFKSKIRDADLTLERAQLEAKSQMRLANALEATKKSQWEQQKGKLDDLLSDEKKLVVKASRPGLVVYDMGWRGRNQGLTIEVGAKIDPHQQIMIIPDMSTLQVRTRVYEAFSRQVAKGAEAYVRLDAMPGRTINAHVERVAPLPDNQNWYNPTSKVYNTFVKLDQPIEGLKPGMTGQVEMILARLPNVLTVPVAAVFSEQEQRYCWRSDGVDCRRVPIKTGRMSDTRVEVLDGLHEGDLVMLSPPPGVQTAPTPKPDTQPAEADATKTASRQ